MMETYRDLLEEIYLIRLSDESAIKKAYYIGQLEPRATRIYMEGKMGKGEYEHIVKAIKKALNSFEKRDIDLIVFTK